jgi:hypothetical protein
MPAAVSLGVVDGLQPASKAASTIPWMSIRIAKGLLRLNRKMVCENDDGSGADDRAGAPTYVRREVWMPAGARSRVIVVVVSFLLE